jgi:hypothetical protein
MIEKLMLLFCECVQTCAAAAVASCVHYCTHQQCIYAQCGLQTHRHRFMYADSVVRCFIAVACYTVHARIVMYAESDHAYKVCMQHIGVQSELNSHVQSLATKRQQQCQVGCWCAHKGRKGYYSDATRSETHFSNNACSYKIDHRCWFG